MLPQVRRLLQILAILGAMLAILWVWGIYNARADPIVRRASVPLPDWPRGAAPIRVALISDVHIGNASMDAARLTRIVSQIDALKPDLVLIAGDFVYGHDPVAAGRYAQQFIAPLAALRAPLGVVATFGNHDEGTDPGLILTALQQAHVVVLRNQAIARGPLAIGGVGDVFSGHDDLGATLGALNHVSGARVIVTHSPDLAPLLPPTYPLLLAGHTHCGQVVLPGLGPVSKVAAERYRCGMVREGARTTIVTGGLGTSGVPLRFGAPPDLWLVTLGPG